MFLEQSIWIYSSLVKSGPEQLPVPLSTRCPHAHFITTTASSWAALPFAVRSCSIFLTHMTFWSSVEDWRQGWWLHEQGPSDRREFVLSLKILLWWKRVLLTCGCHVKSSSTAIGACLCHWRHTLSVQYLTASRLLGERHVGKEGLS